VFAAASLTDAFSEIEAGFEEANPDTDLELNFAGSSSLREQILAGAPADVFASANSATMDVVVDAGDVVGDPQVFAANELIIAVPAGNAAGVAGLVDLADPDLLVGLCAEGVPCGEFARQALARAGVTPSLDTNEPDVRSLLTKIGAGELDAGVVYVTDVTARRDAVEGIEIAARYNVVARYPIAALRTGANPVGAEAFIRYVLSPEGQAVLGRYGFSPR
jgi:molybdate transport system substrate-binding protein